jgi:hypothetical protein
VIKVISEAQAMVSGIQLAEQFSPVAVIPLGRDRWMTTEAARFCIDAGLAWVVAEIEAGFVCDMDSVPREAGIFHAIFKGRARTAAVIHDALYRSGIDRELADAAFIRAMKLEGVRKRYRYPIYWAVRLFGGEFYEKARVKHAA